MAKVKEKMKEVIELKPNDATHEALLNELTFVRMADRGLEDSRKGHVIPNEEMERRISSRQR